MADNKSFKERYTKEKEKISQMDATKKKGYLLEYYLKPFLAIAAVAACVIFFFANILFGGKEVAFEGAGVNVVISDTGKALLTEGFGEALGLEKASVEFESDMNITFELENTDQYAYANRMKLMAQVAAGEVDYFIMSREVYENLSKDDLFLDISEIDCPYEIVNGNAVILTDTAVAQKLEIESADGIYLAFLSSSKKQNTIQEYIDYICE